MSSIATKFAARVRLTAGRQLVAAAQSPAPRWRIETAAGATWGHYAVAHTPADAANLERAARRGGRGCGSGGRRGERVHVTHDASGACHLVTIPD